MSTRNAPDLRLGALQADDVLLSAGRGNPVVNPERLRID
jgi:hypothetical protein